VEDRRHVAAQAFREAQGDVEQLFALDHLGEGLASYCGADDGVNVGHAYAPNLALVGIHPELQVGLPLDAEYEHVFQTLDGLQTALDLAGQLFEDVQVGPDDLDRVIALDAGQGFHDVVANVLREVPVHARD